MLVCQVAFVEWTDAGHLRHCTFVAIRDVTGLCGWKSQQNRTGGMLSLALASGFLIVDKELEVLRGSTLFQPRPVGADRYWREACRVATPSFWQAGQPGG